MPTKQASHRSITKTDVFSGATITAILTFSLLTLSKGLDSSHWLHPYLTDQLISLTAGIGSITITFLLSVLRFNVNLVMYNWTHTSKLKVINSLIQDTSCSVTKASLEKAKNKLIIETASKALSEKL